VPDVQALILQALSKADSRWESAVRRFKAATEKKTHYRRACGECTACCTAISVHELKKNAAVPCKHLCARGCGIYEQRPASCAHYECLWLSGVTPEGWQPKKYGIILDITTLPSKELAILIREAKARAFMLNSDRYVQAVALAANLCLASTSLRHIALNYWGAPGVTVFKITKEGNQAQLELVP
jgi:hypothetical protein